MLNNHKITEDKVKLLDPNRILSRSKLTQGPFYHNILEGATLVTVKQ